MRLKSLKVLWNIHEAKSENVDSTLGQQKIFSINDENDDEEALALLFHLSLTPPTVKHHNAL